MSLTFDLEHVILVLVEECIDSLGFKLSFDKIVETLNWLVFEDAHEVILHGLLESLLVWSWIENGWSFALIEEGFLNLGLENLLK